jgi:hypothetical protein
VVLLVLVHDLGELDYLLGDVATGAALCIGCGRQVDSSLLVNLFANEFSMFLF